MKICIINPNSSIDMTRVIEENARKYADGEFEIECIANSGAPEFIGSYEDMLEAEVKMIKIVKEKQDEYDAFIIACHSDPGLDVLKEISKKPIVGICEASLKLATMLGHSFSVISTGERPIPNKEALCRKYGVTSYLASVVGPREFKTDWHNIDSFIETGRRAVVEDKAEVLVLGCAGMGHITKQMEEKLGVPVLDGVVCALIVATGLVKAGLSTSKVRRYCRREGGVFL
ncbi:aspartate/glutamate racemase family protein [Sinanaerobacter sp. ZZT-01]|uniref:aspartate/glutamate racemase family protein n=1 Tax=Sinanaerobacter sp. ZZT-01 TaxID=3111540 RepID=UPI002D787112|nr:aspartate/glutamate racemase family protein [Sinanaerobacter sp. ZZT-01]WRR94587.1 aspartate/glutamate racemase family protein [Sinanaerobacter sp. ZZT-01]